MVFTVANQEAGSGEVSLVNEAQIAIAARRDNRRIEVDQVRVIGLVALSTADTVRVVARTARRVFAAYVLIVFPETLVVQYAALAVAVVAELVNTGTVLRVVGGLVSVYQYGLEGRTVRPFRSCAAGALCRIRIVAIAARDDGLLG